MLIGVVLMLCILSVPAAGGRLGALQRLRFRRAGLAVAALGLQIVIIELVPAGAPTVHHAVHLASYALVAVFVASNLRVPGVWLVALGGAGNAAAIAINGGTMPASHHALATAGMLQRGTGFQNSAAVAHPRLAFLGDVFAVPHAVPFHNVYSIGDVLLCAGSFVLLHVVSRSRLAPLLSRRPRLDAFEPVAAGASTVPVRALPFGPLAPTAAARVGHGGRDARCRPGAQRTRTRRLHWERRAADDGDERRSRGPAEEGPT